jgi:hypothetical protein
MINELTPAPKGETRNKMEGPTSKNTNEPPKRANHKGNIKFLNPPFAKKTYQIRKGENLLKGCLAR